MRLSKILFFALLMLQFSCANECDDSEELRIRITNNTTAANLAIKLPNMCWRVLTPTNYIEIELDDFEQASLTAFTESDDLEAYENARFDCDLSFVQVVIPEEAGKSKNFVFDNEGCKKGIDLNIYAENSGEEGSGISSVMFRQD